MTGPKVSQRSFWSSLPVRSREAGQSLWYLNSGVSTSSSTLYAAAAPLAPCKKPRYDVFDIYLGLLWCQPPPHTLDLSQRLCVYQWAECLTGEGRHCCGGWSSLERHTPVKEVVLHLLKGHLRHINFIILHPVWTRSRKCVFKNWDSHHFCP